MFRRGILAGLAALLIANSCAAQLLATNVGRGAWGSVLQGTPLSVTIRPDGWTASVKFAGLTCANTLASYAPTPDATPKFTIAVTSPGFTTAGGATSISRTVVATKILRKPYANDGLPDEAASIGDCVSNFALSDFVNVNDTGTASFLTALFTSGATPSLAAGSQAVVNQSTVLHPLPVCNWLTPPHGVIAPGAGFTVEVLCFHARPQSGKQVQAVKFDFTDGTNHVFCTTSSMAQVNALANTGNPIYGYSCTVSAGGFASLTAGSCAAGASCEITADFTAYPIVGNRSLVASAGQDGVAIAASVRTPNLHAQNFVWDQNSKYGPIYGWISTTGTVGICVTNGCISTASTDPGTGAALNYGTFFTFADNCRSYNSANRGHNDTSGCVGIVRADAAINGYNLTAGTELDTLTPGLAWLTFRAAPGQSNTTVVIKRAAAATGTGQVNDRTWFENIGFTQVDAVSAAYNEEIIGADGSNTNPIATEIVCNACAFTASAANFPMVYKTGLVRHYNIADTEVAGEGNVLSPFGVARAATTVFGGAITKNNQGLSIWPYTMAGVVVNKGRMTLTPSTSPNFVCPTGVILAFNKSLNSTLPLDVSGTAPLCTGLVGHFANVQNLFEKTTVDGGIALRFLADSDITPWANYVEQYVTYAGGRKNWLYNDGGSAGGGALCTPKTGVSLYTAYSAMTGQGSNVKTDTFLGSNGQNGARICNWSVTNGVGSIGNVVWKSAGGDTAPGSTSWLGDYWGRTGSATANNFGYNQVVAFTSDASAGGTNAGGGTYTITGGAASPAYGRVPSGAAGLPGDLAGTARRNDGTGCAGSFEC